MKDVLDAEINFFDTPSMDAAKRFEAGIGVPYICRELEPAVARILTPHFRSPLVQLQPVEPGSGDPADSC